MLKEIILINSARFDFARVRLDRDLFFLGDNGSGKTTFIRAIHFLYSADQRSVGIPADKVSFKNYYFPYENSYIFYVFEEFFIFMYKRQNDIVKIFSKQPFNLNNIIDENRNLLDLQAIRKYATAVYNKVTRGVSEYQEIIYGIDKRYLDFKIADIKNVDIFLNLYNQLFNIDKAIIDSKSIKKAIQTSLNLDEKFQQFNAQEYLQKIREFEANYRFFKEFERREKDIDKAYRLKRELLLLESDLFSLHKKINYRLEYEKRLEQENLQKLTKLKSQLERLSLQRTFWHQVLQRIEKRCENQELELKKRLTFIQSLKERFTSTRLQEAKELIAQKFTIQRELDRLNEEIIKIEGEFESVRKSLESEIYLLQQKRDIELPRQKEYKEQLLKTRFQELFAKQKEQIEFISEQKIASLEQKIEQLQNTIEEIGINIEKIEHQIEKLFVQKEQQEQSFQNQIQQLDKEKEQKILNTKTLNKEILAKIDTLENSLTKTKRAYKTKRQKALQPYKKELKQITDSIKELQGQLYTKPQSFKEFLNEHIFAWEKRLYPLLDSSLLDKSIQELQPKIISEPIIGIEVDTSSLKKILSKDEAKEQLKKEHHTLKALQEAFYTTIVELNEKQQKDTAVLLVQIKSLQKEMDFNNQSLQESIKELEKKKEEIQSQRAALLQTLQNKQNELKEQKEALRTQQKELQQDIKELQQKIKSQKERSKKKIAQEQTSLQKELKQQQKELQEWLTQEQHHIDEQIAKLQSQILHMSKDERALQLKQQKEQKEQILQKIYEAQSFLEEYKRQKEKLTKYSAYQQALFRIQNSHKRLADRNKKRDKRLLAIKEELEQSKKTIEQELAKVQKGLQIAFERFTDEKKPSQEYLIDLYEKFITLDRKYRDKKIDLKEVLDTISRSLKGFYQIKADFRLREFEEAFVSNMQETLYRIDELYEFKQKQFEINKEGESERFRNFVNALLLNQLANFKRSEDKFLSQTVKINKNLAKVDFGVIRHIKLVTKSQNKRSIALMLTRLKNQIEELSTFFKGNTLFYDANEAQKILANLQSIFLDIKKELKGDAISLVDTIDLSLEFEEGGVLKQNISQIKNESSTGGSILLKMAIAISILKLFIKNKSNFFLIVDEVSRLHSQNQEKLRSYANENGFKIIFVTPEPTFANPKAIQYYKFAKKKEGFEVIELNRV